MQSEVARKMEVRLSPNGVAYIRYARCILPCMNRCKNMPDTYWSSWYWLPEIKQANCDVWDSLAVKGMDTFAELCNRRSEMIAAMNGSKEDIENYATFEKIWDQVFKIPLWDIQKQAAALMIQQRLFYLAYAVGLGKTLAASAAMYTLLVTGFVKRAVIVCPASVKHQWKLELQRAIQEEWIKKYPIVVIDGSPDVRKGKYSDSAIAIVGYETLRADAKDERDPFDGTADLVIFDEAWKFKSSTSQLQRTLRRLFAKTKYKFALNASPIANGYTDLYGVIDVLDSKVFLTWKNFSRMYCRFIEIRSKRKRFMKLIGYKNEQDLRRRIKHLIYRKTIDDLDWKHPKLSVTPYWIDLDKEQRVAYNSVVNDKSAIPVARTVNARVAALFTVNTPPKKSPKYKELLEILTEVCPEDKVIVFCESRQFLEGIIGDLKSKGVKADTLTGGDEAKERTLKQELFWKGAIRVLLLTAAGEAGINLNVADVYA